MIKFYQNRELSECLGIRLSRWKRWSREFLPPDPLGGLQSGYARQYTFSQAFTVYLGGHLVSNLGYSIPETRQILDDLEEWVKEKECEICHPDDRNGLDCRENAQQIRLYIFKRPDPENGVFDFFYIERTILSDASCQKPYSGCRQEIYIEKKLATPGFLSLQPGEGDERSAFGDMNRMDSKILYLSELYILFNGALG